MTLLFVENLTIIDFSYLHAERGLLGESWLLDVELEGDLDAQGMVLDFARIKHQLKQTVDRHFDHKLLVPTAYQGVRQSRQGENCSLSFVLTNGDEIYHQAPAGASCDIETEEITPETVAAGIVHRFQPGLPSNVHRLSIRLRPEQKGGHYYHVSHGLKHHDGNCQRIAHGHRSYIQIFRDGAQDSTLEEVWATRWKDIYIGTRDDLLETSQRAGIEYYRFGYQSAQGRFELKLPKSRCYLINTDSTVENLAQHVAQELKREHPQSCFQVRAFEGIGKGAVVTL